MGNAARCMVTTGGAAAGSSSYRGSWVDAEELGFWERQMRSRASIATTLYPTLPAELVTVVYEYTGKSPPPQAMQVYVTSVYVRSAGFGEKCMGEFWCPVPQCNLNTNRRTHEIRFTCRSSDRRSCEKDKRLRDLVRDHVRGHLLNDNVLIRVYNQQGDRMR